VVVVVVLPVSCSSCIRSIPMEKNLSEGDDDGLLFGVVVVVVLWFVFVLSVSVGLSPRRLPLLRSPFFFFLSRSV